MRVAVVGATGAVGTTMLRLLRERAFPAREIVPFASPRSAGRDTEDGLTVRALGPDADLDGFDVALFSAGSAISREWAPRFVEHGAVVVDNSSAWRMEPDVPLIVAEVNAEAIDRHRGIIANPNCSAMQALVVLKPIHDAAGLERIVFSSYQSTSGTGARAMQELRDQAHAILHEQPSPEPAVYPHPIAFNVLPQVETFKDGDDYTTEERKVIAESRKILGLPDLRITATCARVPVLNCHSEALNVETRRDLGPEDCRRLLARAPGVEVVDDPASGRYPLPSEAAGRDEVFVGRIRRDESNPRTLNLWVVGDNLRKGAATNAVQIAELLLGRQRLPAGAAVSG
ncbi:MAG: aspartate-semialdehyde dehydrogenase [Solirubrobacterales bacterium]|nr:aspartate-semialdehyde dehydrogenase [Solirubrobacterales bacterium]MBV9716169.1 aspartate-semialdehyde dehydrogenase [Solirubrobacterales bacterium]